MYNVIMLNVGYAIGQVLAFLTVFGGPIALASYVVYKLLKKKN